jgi:O-antigen/teichoic acid export membrane protein
MSNSFAATRWILIGAVGFRIVSLAGQMAIVQLVAKEAFGAYRGVVALLLMGLTLLPFGIDSLVSRERQRMRRYVIALSGVLAVLGAAMALAYGAAAMLPAPGAASWLARWLDLGADSGLLWYMPAVVAAQAMRLSARAPLAARLDFRTISAGEFLNGVVTWVGGAAVVLRWPTAEALMAAYLAGEAAEALWLFRRTGIVWSLPFRRATWARVAWLRRRHFSFCAFNCADLMLSNIGSLIPGTLFLAWIGKEANADFQVASTLIILPVMLLVGSIQRVALPTLTGLPEAELQRRCLAIMGAAAAWIAPAILWFAAFADATVHYYAGERYAQAAALVQWMACYMIVNAIFSPISSLDLIRDRPEVGLWWNIGHTLARIASIWWGSRDGIAGAVQAMSLTSLVFWIGNAFVLGWLLRAPWRGYFGASARFVPLWAAFAGGLWLCRAALPEAHRLVPVALSAVPCALYVAAVLRWFPREAELAFRVAGRR